MGLRRLYFIKTIAGNSALALGGTLVLFAALMEHSDGGPPDIVLPGLFFGACLAWAIWDAHAYMRRLTQCDACTLAQYKERHPALTQNNVLRCYKCRCSEVAVHRVKDMPHFEHACANCGTPLYYTPTS